MTDRELEARLRALYRTRVPADDLAPVELRSELAAIVRVAPPAARFGGSRAWVLLAAAALLAAMLIGGALLAGSGLLRSIALVPPSESPVLATPLPSDGPPFIGGWPTYGGDYPAGLYTWQPSSPKSWMHKLFAGSSVEMRFRVASPTYELEAFKAALAIYGDGAIVEQPVQIPLPPGHPVIQCAPIEPVASGPPTEPVAEPLPGYARCGRPPATQTWLLDMDGTVVAFDIMTFPDTPPALLAEAEAAIRSVRVDRTPEGEPRLVFELTQGWDSG